MRFVTSMVVVVAEVSNGGFGLLLIFPPTFFFPSQEGKLRGGIGEVRAVLERFSASRFKLAQQCQ